MSPASKSSKSASKLKKTDHVFLVDGSGYIFRAYHALPPLTRKSDGLQVNALTCRAILFRSSHSFAMR